MVKPYIYEYNSCCLIVIKKKKQILSFYLRSFAENKF